MKRFRMVYGGFSVFTLMYYSSPSQWCTARQFVRSESLSFWCVILLGSFFCLPIFFWKNGDIYLVAEIVLLGVVFFFLFGRCYAIVIRVVASVPWLRHGQRHGWQEGPPCAAVHIVLFIEGQWPTIINVSCVLFMSIFLVKLDTNSPGYIVSFSGKR